METRQRAPTLLSLHSIQDEEALPASSDNKILRSVLLVFIPPCHTRQQCMHFPAIHTLVRRANAAEDVYGAYLGEAHALCCAACYLLAKSEEEKAPRPSPWWESCRVVVLSLDITPYGQACIIAELSFFQQKLCDTFAALCSTLEELPVANILISAATYLTARAATQEPSRIERHPFGNCTKLLLYSLHATRYLGVA